MQHLIETLIKNNAKIATAESCTGGGIAHALTTQAGSSAWFDQGWVTYTAAAKQQQLGVTSESVRDTTVSAQVASQMALGALERASAQVAVSITGVAGPSGGTALHPVGCCWFGFALQTAVWSNLPVCVYAADSSVSTAWAKALEAQFKFITPDSLHWILLPNSLCLTVRCDFAGDRIAVRAAAVDFALQFCGCILQP